MSCVGPPGVPAPDPDGTLAHRDECRLAVAWSSMLRAHSVQLTMVPHRSATRHNNGGDRGRPVAVFVDPAARFLYAANQDPIRSRRPCRPSGAPSGAFSNRLIKFLDRPILPPCSTDLFPCSVV